MKGVHLGECPKFVPPFAFYLWVKKMAPDIWIFLENKLLGYSLIGTCMFLLIGACFIVFVCKSWKFKVVFSDRVSRRFILLEGTRSRNFNAMVDVHKHET